MKAIILKAPAKINLYLKIVSQREDRYHDISSLMQMVGLYDLLTLREAPSGIDLKVENSSLPADRSNLIFRAAELIQREAETVSGVLKGVSITLIKNIPVAAGLGGGSSDAAATMLGLNRLWSLGWSRKRLADLSASLGSDLPFFFYGPTAWVSGRGEKIDRAGPLFDGWAALVNPGYPVSTAWAYAQFSEKMGLTKKGGEISMNSSNLEEILRHPHNDLESVTLAAFPHLIEIKREFHELGGEGVLMSGSGPTVFALFRKFEDAEKAASAVKRRHSLPVWVAKILRRSPI